MLLRTDREARDYMLVKEMMCRRVVSVTPQMTLREVSRLFAKHGISGAPVLGPQGGLIGVISKTDIFSQPETVPARLRCGGHERLRVEQAMTPWVVSLEEDTPMRELARQMLTKRIHRIIITREGNMCGIVTTLDVVRALLKEVDAVSAATVKAR